MAIPGVTEPGPPDRTRWSSNVARCIAAGEGNIRLTVGHQQLIHKLRDHYLTGRRIPVMRQLCRKVGVKRRRIDALLQDPTAALRIAGLR